MLCSTIPKQAQMSRMEGYKFVINKFRRNNNNKNNNKHKKWQFLILIFCPAFHILQ